MSHHDSLSPAILFLSLPLSPSCSPLLVVVVVVVYVAPIEQVEQVERCPTRTAREENPAWTPSCARRGKRRTQRRRR